MPTTLIDCESIPLTNGAFRDWMIAAGQKLREFDEQHYDILTDYFRNGNDDVASRQRDAQIHNLKWDLIGLKLEIQAVMHLWKQLRHEMD